MQSIVIQMSQAGRFTVDIPGTSVLEIYNRLCSAFSAQLFLQPKLVPHGEQCINCSKCFFGLSNKYLLPSKVSVQKTYTLNI